MSSCSLRIRIYNLTPSRSLSTSREYVVLLSSHPGRQSDTITLPLHLQRVRRPTLFASGSTISHHHALSLHPESMSSCSLRIQVHNLTPSHSLSTSSWYVVLLSSHLGPQSHTIPLPLRLQRVRHPALFASGSTISHRPAPSPPPSWYVVLLSSHPGPQSHTIPLPLHLQRVRCPALFTSRSTISHHHTPSPMSSIGNCTGGSGVNSGMAMTMTTTAAASMQQQRQRQ